MSDELRDLPLILRREEHGGSLYDPSKGTLLDVDREGFEFLKDYRSLKEHSMTGNQRAFLQQLRSEVNLSKGRVINYRENPEVQDRKEIPHLYAPNLVDFQVTNRCYMGCPHCYADSTPEDVDCSWEDMRTVLDNLERCGVHQIAIGGGEPLLHPRIGDFLAECTRKGVVPNLTTNGMHFDDDILTSISRHCGAVGMSLEGVGERFDQWRAHGFKKFERALTSLLEFDVRTAVQITVSKANLDSIDHMCEYIVNHFPNLYGVVFLAFKPVGRGASFDQPLSSLPTEQVSGKLQKAFHILSPHMRVGFDCCLSPAIAGIEKNQGLVNDSLLEGCSAMRGSLGITANLDVVPCTFVTQFVMGNLRSSSLEDIWNHTTGRRFRSHMKHRIHSNPSCSQCEKQQHCVGGCPVMPLVNCHNDYQSHGILAFKG